MIGNYYVALLITGNCLSSIKVGFAHLIEGGTIKGGENVLKCLMLQALLPIIKNFTIALILGIILEGVCMFC